MTTVTTTSSVTSTARLHRRPPHQPPKSAPTFAEGLSSWPAEAYGVLAGFCVLCALACLCLCLFRRKRSKRKEQKPLDPIDAFELMLAKVEVAEAVEEVEVYDTVPRALGRRSANEWSEATSGCHVAVVVDKTEPADNMQVVEKQELEDRLVTENQELGDPPMLDADQAEEPPIISGNVDNAKSSVCSDLVTSLTPTAPETLGGLGEPISAAPQASINSTISVAAEGAMAIFVHATASRPQTLVGLSYVIGNTSGFRCGLAADRTALESSGRLREATSKGSSSTTAQAQRRPRLNVAERTLAKPQTQRHQHHTQLQEPRQIPEHQANAAGDDSIWDDRGAKGTGKGIGTVAVAERMMERVRQRAGALRCDDTALPLYASDGSLDGEGQSLAVSVGAAPAGLPKCLRNGCLYQKHKSQGHGYCCDACRTGKGLHGRLCEQQRWVDSSASPGQHPRHPRPHEGVAGSMEGQDMRELAGRPAVGDTVVILDTIRTRRYIVDGISKQLVIRSDAGEDKATPYEVEGYDAHLSDHDVRLIQKKQESPDVSWVSVAGSWLTVPSLLS